ncbi:MAG: HAD-IIIA family hydrolase [Gemmatimonadota bacterium]
MRDKVVRPLRPAVFVDRDGTIVAERNYLADPAQVELVPGASAALRDLAAHGFRLVIVTNQSGIARGLYQEEDFQAVQQRLDELLALDGVKIDAVYFCPHHPDFSGPCDCRKPGPGMYRRAQRDLGIDLSRSAYVGDRVKDVEPAVTFEGFGVLVRTGYGAEEEAGLPPGQHVADDIAAAAKLILEKIPEKPGGPTGMWPR